MRHRPFWAYKGFLTAAMKQAIPETAFVFVMLTIIASIKGTNAGSWAELAGRGLVVAGMLYILFCVIAAVRLRPGQRASHSNRD